jgi:hypothetical protein
MICAHRTIAALVDIFAHIKILRRKLPGIQPPENEQGMPIKSVLLTPG